MGGSIAIGRGSCGTQEQGKAARRAERAQRMVQASVAPPDLTCLRPAAVLPMLATSRAVDPPQIVGRPLIPTYRLLQTTGDMVATST